MPSETREIESPAEALGKPRASNGNQRSPIPSTILFMVFPRAKSIIPLLTWDGNRGCRDFSAARIFALRYDSRLPAAPEGMTHQRPLRGLLAAQFLGAFNDNAWKMIVTFLAVAPLDP